MYKYSFRVIYLIFLKITNLVICTFVVDYSIYKINF